MKRKRALELCRDLWDELSKTGIDEKEGTKFCEKHPSLNSDCPCCEYVSKFPKIYRSLGLSSRPALDCKRCPLKKAWPFDDLVAPCINDESPYERWGCASTKKERKKYARIIRDAAIAELKKYKGYTE